MTNLNQFLGISKTLYNSGITFLFLDKFKKYTQITLLSERFLRIKSSGNWPKKVLLHLLETNYVNLNKMAIADNRDVITPEVYEDYLNDIFPFDTICARNKLDVFQSKNIKNFIGHHECHAYCALRFSPYQESIILVIDGAGSKYSDLDLIQLKDVNHLGLDTSITQHEEYSIYLQKGADLKCVQKKWQSFYFLPELNKKVTNGIGIAYETVAEYIFASNQAAGKVMGLASYGVPQNFSSVEEFLKSLDWSKRFNKGDIWEESPHINLYQDIAATIQFLYEKYLDHILDEIHQLYPQISNLILVGGCALNCTHNTKIVKSSSFKNLFIPPAPDDRGISIGLAFKELLKIAKSSWSPLSYSKQSAYFGDIMSIPCQEEVRTVFSSDKYEIQVQTNITKYTAKQLYANKIIAWFDGRSECGPRALGNRSILASPLFPNLKKYLNDNIKFREKFRPYGATCIYEDRNIYFDFPINLETPFMSFTIPVKKKYKKILQEITHVDGTSRVQTLRYEQNKKLYDVLKYFKEFSSIACLLNTSLNVMGQPIVETIYDLEKMFDLVPLDAVVIGDFFITKK